ncbi:MAG: hypothetical protein IKU48_04860 [Clostridia bacterium]|nr:hypothetical protein [Clostridia bacterium]
MEKFIFLATIKDRLAEINLPKESIDKHLNIFEDCFKGKSSDEIDSVIESAGGVDGIIKSIQNLENVKTKKNQDTSVNASAPVEDIIKDIQNTMSKESPEVAPESLDEVLSDISNDTADNDVPTMEIPKARNIDKHIREAEEMTETMERIPVLQDKQDEEFSAELSEYDFEMLFEERLSKLEILLNNIRKKISPKKYKATMPVAIIIASLAFAVVGALFPLLILSSVAFSIAYICTVVAGVCFAIIPIGYGIYMSFKLLPIALYELSIGIISLGITMLLSILLYNYVKRLVPFLFKKIIELFKFCIKLSKCYFGKQVKEEA